MFTFLLAGHPFVDILARLGVLIDYEVSARSLVTLNAETVFLWVGAQAALAGDPVELYKSEIRKRGP